MRGTVDRRTAQVIDGDQGADGRKVDGERTRTKGGRGRVQTWVRREGGCP
jgi:predicted aconitase with swiveling domain